MNNTFNLWQLLSKYEVIIPVIQRDYAQGRKDKEYIRKAFLSEIKTHVENNKPLTLDFIYGNVENKRFYPLDGQQRLTTLWLIYWFISIKSGKIEEDKKHLLRFAYETRTSSKDFCKALCEKVPSGITGEIEDDKKIADYIKSRTWFYSSWLQDPTVSSMLRTISGDKESVDDNIEDVFRNVDFVLFRERLILFPLVKFELMVIGNEKLPISDDLYIKINARGKSLTDFENLKADLVAWIQNEQNPDTEEFNKISPDKRFCYKQYYPAQIDNAWMDVFWKHALKKAGTTFNGRIDSVFFSFINRYVLNQICLVASMQPAEYAPGKENESHKTIKKAFDTLFGTGSYGSAADESLVGYKGFDVYRPYLTFESISKLDYILQIVSDDNVLDLIESTLNVNDADDEESEKTGIAGYSYVPRATSEMAIIPAKQKERVYFLAVSRFIENCQTVGSFEQEKFNRWMRVVKNLIENAAIDNVPAMVTCMRLIDKLAQGLRENKNDIYCTLTAYSDPISSNRFDCQLKEEKEKAEQIIADPTWEKKIEDAEKYAFFNGTVRFLYRNENGLCWNEFDKKFDTAKLLFSSNKVDLTTVKKLLEQFGNFDELKDKYFFTTVGYHSRHKCWKRDILCSDDVLTMKNVHRLLMDLHGAGHNTDYQSFLGSGLIDKIVGKDESFKYRYHWHGYWAVHKDYSQTEGVYVSAERKAKCQALKKLIDTGIVVLPDSGFNTYHNGYFWGIKVTFEFNGISYNWYESYENGKCVDKIHRYEKGVDSKKALTWDKTSDLISSINNFTSWN